ncbi:Flagellar assembly protein FliH [Enterobacter sp. DC4]|uniref:flagellar assembly protein FliH n=1 Tax=Enterobacter sp. DC4 TaxID=1395580 RepID=UPI0003ECFE40|nr:flagellar assembly protein FliH [Enterobacter sp. DC4]EWG67263.1 Flagellar assembly protein FliH [Enterobacter sp. DC4]
MSTSDHDWRNWQPEDLLGTPAWDETSPQMVAAEPGLSPEIQQAELARLQQMAEHRGFSQGQQKGLEEGKKQGYEIGLQQGREEGIAQGKAEGLAHQKQLAEQFGTLLESFKTALDDLDSVVPSRLVQMALTAARSMLGKHIVNDSTHSQLFSRVQQLLAEDPLLKGYGKLWISTHESEQVRQALEEVVTARGWELCIDSHLLPGGCRMSTDEGELDATLRTRWQALCRLSWEEIS